MPDIAAELAYVFRHALLRAAAYELQLPAERAGLHQLAAGLIEELCGGNEGHLAGVAAEVAQHLRIAREHRPGDALLAAERRFTKIAAQHAERNWDHAAVQQLYGRLADIGDPLEQGHALQVLCASYKLSHRDKHKTRAAARRLLRLARGLNNAALAAKALTILALDAPASRRFRLERMAYRVAAAAGAWLPAGLALGNMALQYKKSGDLRRAAPLLRRAIVLSLRAGNVTGAGHFQGALAAVLQAQGKKFEALAAARQAVQRLTETNSVQWLPHSLRTLAQICAQQALWDEADSACRQTGQAFERMRQPAELAHVAFERALLQLSQGRIEPARELWRSGTALVKLHGPSINNAEPEAEMRRRCTELGIATLDTA